MTSLSRLIVTSAVLLVLVAPALAEQDIQALLETVRKDADPAAFDDAVKKLREMDSKTQYLLEKELNFYSNDSPTPGRKTEKDRAALAGYKDPVTQFIHTGSTITGALPVWLRSAIHHRLLAGTEFIEAGFGVHGPLTLVLGMGERTTPPVLVY